MEGKHPQVLTGRTFAAACDAVAPKGDESGSAESCSDQDGCSPSCDKSHTLTTPDSGFRSDRSLPLIPIRLKVNDVITETAPLLAAYSQYPSANLRVTIGPTSESSASHEKERLSPGDQLHVSPSLSAEAEKDPGCPWRQAMTIYSTGARSDSTAHFGHAGYISEADTTTKTPRGCTAPATDRYSMQSLRLQARPVDVKIPIDIDQMLNLPLDLSCGIKKRRLTFEDNASPPIKFSKNIFSYAINSLHDSKTAESATFDCHENKLDSIDSICQQPISQQIISRPPINANSSANPIWLSDSVVKQHESSKAKRQWHSERAKSILEDWYKLNEHCPYASDEDRLELARLACITGEQVIKWLANKRQRTGNTLTKNGQIHPKKTVKIREIREAVEQRLSGSGAETNLGNAKGGGKKAVSNGAETNFRNVEGGGKRKLDEGYADRLLPPSEQTAGTQQSNASDCESDNFQRLLGDRRCFSGHHSSAQYRFLSASQVDGLESWFRAHLSYPYPNPEERSELSQRLRLTHSQIVNWFANKRSRLHAKGSNNNKSTPAFSSSRNQRDHPGERVDETPAIPSTTPNSPRHLSDSPPLRFGSAQRPQDVVISALPHSLAMPSRYQPPSFPLGFLTPPHAAAMMAAGVGLAPFGFDTALMLAAATLSFSTQARPLPPLFASPWMQCVRPQRPSERGACAWRHFSSSAAQSRESGRKD